MGQRDIEDKCNITADIAEVGTLANNDPSKEDATAFLAAHGAVRIYDEAATRKLVRKIDMHLMPMMMASYCLQYIDKSAVSYAAVFGIRADLGLTGFQFSLLGSLFYIGYLVAEYPMAYISQRIHIGRFLGGIIFIWGWVLMSTALAQNFAHAAAVRFLLGLFEAALTPSFIMITGMWYTRQEQPFRVGIWYSMNGFGNMFGALTAYGTGLIDYDKFLSWRWVFIIFGCVTVLWSFVPFFFFPSSPMRASWLTEEERVHAVERLRVNRTGVLNREWKWYQVREALNPFVDPSGWLLFWACVFNEVVNGGVATYKTLIINAIGWNKFQSALFGIPQGFSLTLQVLLCGYIAGRFRDFRIYAMSIFLVPSFIGILLQVVLPAGNVVGRTIGVILMPSFVGTLAVTMGLPAQNTGGYTKRSVTVGMAFIGYCVGNILGPLAFVDGQQPAYISGYVTCLACFGVQWIIFAVLRWYWVRQNARRAKLVAEKEANGSLEEHDEFADRTDVEDLRFRYNL